MINFTQLVDNLNIPALRQVVHTAWLNIIVSPLNQVQTWWNERVNGSSYPTFNNTTDYTIYDTVQYGRASFWCIKTPPSGLYPLPTNTNYWYKILDDYIGLDERSHYSAQKVMLEYALNRRFSPTTVTPPFSSSIPSIYIENHLINRVNIIYSAPHTTNTNTWTAPITSNQFWFCPLGNPSTTTVYNYTIYVPAAIFSAIDADPIQAASIIEQEANRYNLAGIIFDVQSY